MSRDRQPSEIENELERARGQGAAQAAALEAVQVQAAAWKARALAAERQLREARVLADQLYGALGVVDSEA